MISSIIVIFLGFSGFCLSTYLAHKKRRKSEPFICPMRGHCADVIRSDFSKFLGVPVEIMGMFYYGFLAIGYGLTIAIPTIALALTPFLLVASVLAFLFSLYLTFIQLVVLRKICTWCLLSATLSTLIAIFAVFGSLELVMLFVSQYQGVFLSLHILAMSVGLGAATVSDLLFFKFIRDFRISEKEASVLTAISDVIWFAVGLIVLGGVGVFLTNTVAYLASGVFLAKMVIVGVIILNGAFLTLFVTPRLIKISFGEAHPHSDGELVRLRRLAFLFGPISIVSWYSAAMVALLPVVEQWNFGLILTVYLGVVLTGVTIGQVLERHLQRKAA